MTYINSDRSGSCLHLQLHLKPFFLTFLSTSHNEIPSTPWICHFSSLYLCTCCFLYLGYISSSFLPNQLLLQSSFQDQFKCHFPRVPFLDLQTRCIPLHSHSNLLNIPFLTTVTAVIPNLILVFLMSPKTPPTARTCLVQLLYSWWLLRCLEYI